ncbi:MAG: ATP-binding protein [Methyloversatilis sp.]|nr:ATP-binding protein [Methyloversatilis sp.]
MPLDLDWNSIRSVGGTKHDGFEELCTQLARAARPQASIFYRKGTPDSGVEAYAVLPDTTEWAWQSKYFQNLGDAQWAQLDESVRTALEGHPRLTRYIVCVPLDLPDGRTGRGKSARQRWDDRVATWTAWATKEGMAVEFVWQGSHELLTQLARSEHAGLAGFFFGARYLDDGWFRDRLAEAHRAAGPRYTPELNVKLSLGEQFQAFGRTSQFFDRIRSTASEIREHLRNHAFRVVKAPDETLTALIVAARSSCEQTLDEFRLLSDEPTLSNPLAALRVSLNEAVGSAREVLAELRRQRDATRAAQQDDAKGKVPRQEEDSGSYGLRQLQSKLQDALSLVDDFVEVVDARLLILTGEAGTGKTHLLCDLANQRLQAGLPTVVLMGQRFLDVSDPWTQAMHQLDLPGWTARELVAALEVVAQRAGRRLLFIVDAINEGAGMRLWPAHLSAFLERMAGSPWIGVVLSVRSSYAEDLLPETVLAQAACVEHHGFEDVEFDATRTFFEHYGIDLPSTPLLAPEFRNPLYLKTLCQGLQAAGESRLPRGFHGVVGAFGLYLSGVNARLASALDFDVRKDLVSKALRGLAGRMVETRQIWISYAEAETIVDALLPGREHSRSLMPRLVAEGLLIEERPWGRSDPSADSVVVIAYERLSDYLCVGVLLDEASTSAALETAFKPGGPLDFEALRTTWTRPGFHEALHTLVAERTGREMLELVPDLAKHHYTDDAFLSSIVWREPNAVTARTVQFLSRLKKSCGSKVIETLITLATIPDSYLNARFLDQELRKSAMADRDAWWSTGLQALWDERSAVDRLVQWSSHLWPHSSLDDEAAELTAMTLAWLLTSSNRHLRDHATKALVRVMTWRPVLIDKLIQRFANLDDAYVAERVLAAAYGATMRTTDAAGVKVVADAAHAAVFPGGRPRPHLLLREYGRGIIKRAEYLIGPDAPSWQGVDPPYASEWPAIPDQAAIDTVVPPWSSGSKAQPRSWGKDRIRSSVLDDDFARYVIGTNSWYTNWLSVRLDQPQWMSLESRIERAVSGLSTDERRAWEYFKEAERESSLTKLYRRLPVAVRGTDSRQPEHMPPSSPADEAVRKVRELVLDMLGPDRRETFSALMEEVIEGTGGRMAPLFDLKLVQRYVLNRVFELGWTAERFEQFDSNLPSRGRAAGKAERMGKKYQWIAYHEMLAYMADHYQYAGDTSTKEIGTAYKGTWQDGFRDIDPSNVMQSFADIDEASADSPMFWVQAGVADWSPGSAPKTWAQMTGDVPLPAQLLFSRDESSQSDWVSLYTELEWSMPKPAYEASYKDGRREIWMNVEGALIKRSDMARLTSKAVARKIAQSSTHSSDNYTIYLGEVGWSEAARHFLDPYFSWLGWTEDARRKGINAIPASQGYMRELGTYDCSLGSESIKLRVPSAEMLELLGANWSGIAATYVDRAGAGTVLAFDPSANTRGPKTFLVRRERLLELMHANDLVVCWAVHGEKMDAAGAPDYRPMARRSFDGLFFWNGGEVEGEYTFDTLEVARAED